VTSGAGGEAPLLPWREDFAPNDADREYAQRFDDLASAVEACAHSEEVLLRLSTCRNQWMTVNAIFVDLRDAAASAGELARFPVNLERAWRPGVQRPASTARSVHTRATTALRRVYLPAAIEAREKQSVWERRAELDAELEAAIGKLSRLAQDRVRAALHEHRSGNPPVTPHIDGRYLALSDEIDEAAEEIIAKLDALQRPLHDVIRIGQHLVAALDPRFDDRSHADPSADPEPADSDADAAEEEAEAEAIVLFDPGESTEESRRREEAEERRAELAREQTELWEIARDAVIAGADLIASRLLDGEGDPALEIDEWGIAPIPRTFDRAAAGVLVELCGGAVDRLRRDLGALFKPNVGEPAMPHPYVIDVLGLEKPSADRERRFRSERVTGSVSPAPASARVALLRCATPARGFVQTEARRRYQQGGDDDIRSWVETVARAAYAEAKAAGATMLVMPEVFLPERSVEEFVKRVREDGEEAVAIVSGVEYDFDEHGDPRNRAVVLLPGAHQPFWQLKKYPSVYEPGPDRFGTDETVLIVRQSPVGVLGVIICSDYLEADLVWHLASCRERIDTLVVCARNPQPQAFERLAAADSLRLYAHVIVVNAYEAYGELSGRGTVVTAPLRAGAAPGQPDVHVMPFLPETRRPLAVAALDGGEQPAVDVHTLDLAAIRHRDNRRSGSKDWLPSPTFPIWRRSDA
jgi:predicted amidohydrolase